MCPTNPFQDSTINLYSSFSFLVSAHNLVWINVYTFHSIEKHYQKIVSLYPAFTTLYEFEPPHSRGFEITHNDTTQSVGLLWTSDQSVAETST
jgi:hypothetical protein